MKHVSLVQLQFSTSFLAYIKEGYSEMDAYHRAVGYAECFYMNHTSQLDSFDKSMEKTTLRYISNLDMSHKDAFFANFRNDAENEGKTIDTSLYIPVHKKIRSIISEINHAMQTTPFSYFHCLKELADYHEDDKDVTITEFVLRSEKQETTDTHEIDAWYLFSNGYETSLGTIDTVNYPPLKR